MTLGKFIAFEGGEGMGKSTQARLLADELARRGVEVVTTREPGGTPGAEAIRALLLSPPGEGWPIEAEALLFAASRADHVARANRPAITPAGGGTLYRCPDSSRAYQGEAGGLGDDVVMQLHQIGSHGLLPDMTLVLEASGDNARERLKSRDGDSVDAIGGRHASYHRAVNAAFSRFADAEPQRFARIDGNGTPDEVHQRIMEALAELLVQKC